MTMEGFTSFLMSGDNSGFSERQLRVCDDMTRPLCEYYISSSHNVSWLVWQLPLQNSVDALIALSLSQTYLIGGQLKGESTSEGYIRAEHASEGQPAEKCSPRRSPVIARTLTAERDMVHSRRLGRPR